MGATKGRFQTGKDIWGSSKIPTADAINQLVEIDFVDYGGIRRLFFRTFGALFHDFRPSSLRGKEQGGTNGINGPCGGISNWLAVYAAPGIIVAYKDAIDIGAIFQDFRTSRNIALKAIIPGHHQSSGPQGVGAGIFELPLII